VNIYHSNTYGYHLKKKVLYQDNQLAMKLEIIGRISCTGNMRHISIRYFFVKDRVDNEEFVIVYCPIKEMIADYFTKPFQGSLFRLLRSIVMGWTHIETIKTSASKEGIGNRVSTDDIKNNIKQTYASVMKNNSTAVSATTEKNNEHAMLIKIK